MKNNQPFNFQEYFDEYCFELSYEDLLELNKQDTGDLNNVLSLLAESCFGVLIYDDQEIIEYVVYFADNTVKLRGMYLKISMKFDSEIRFQLLLVFCKMINHEFNKIDVFDSFNTYQKRLRTGFEKLGYFTIGNEVKEFEGKNAVGIVVGKKGIVRFPTIDKLEMYRSLFSSDKKTQEIFEHKKNKIYLLFDGGKNLIKIGHSKILKIREKTLESQNPNWVLITAWIAPLKIENKLHKRFSAKRVRGEWFALTYIDLQDINEYMTSFEQISIV
ncbi:MAG: GIY-YIG nuclease family protein [Melioribacteraceae bacterium]|nr:MAG: GIY-YIG nuclease family protein [Melioribacteraceae bacterium]